MYRCIECLELFSEPDIYETSYESYYGVLCQFDNTTKLELHLCPCCGSEDIEEVEEDYEYSEQLSGNDI